MAEFVAATVAGQSLVAAAKTFSTGSRGFYASGVIVVDGKQYQSSLTLVEKGTKPAQDDGKAKPKGK